jgi:hypothetical protein
MEENFEELLDVVGLEVDENQQFEEVLDANNSFDASEQAEEEYEVPSKKSRGRGKGYASWKEFDKREDFQVFWDAKKTNWRMRTEHESLFELLKHGIACTTLDQTRVNIKEYY